MRKNNKVFLLSPLPPPVGGIASWTINILGYIQENHIDNFIHLNTAIKLRSITSMNKLGRLLFGIIDSLRIIMYFVFCLVKYSPKVVHLTSSASLALFKDVIIGLICKISSIRYIVHFRFGRIPSLYQSRNWEWMLLKTVIRTSEVTIVLDEKSYQILNYKGFGQKVRLIPNPCSIELEDIAKSEIRPYARNEFIFVGHVLELKGVFDLIKAIVNFENDIKLRLIGPVEPSIKDQLVEIATLKDNGKWLFFEGVKNKTEILDLMQVSHGLLFPSHTEGFPNVVLEAMACGCPVIATNVGAIPEMLDSFGQEPAGLCVALRDLEQFEFEIKHLIDNDQLREDLAINGKKRVLMNYTMKSIFKMYQEVWFNIN